MYNATSQKTLNKEPSDQPLLVVLGTVYPNLYLIISNSLIINIAVKSINN